MVLTQILDQLENVTQNGKQYSARCPAHDDRKNSLSVTQEKDGKILLHCHAGCKTEEILSALGLTMQDLYPAREEARNGGRGKGGHEKGRVTDEYIYTDPSGTPVLKKVRLQYSDSKSFYWQHFTGSSWKTGRNGITPPLYNQNAMEKDNMIFLVEGEKDVKTVKQFGWTAVSLPDGAASRWREEYGPLFRGKEVYILPDNDSAGEQYARMLAEKLFGYADHVRILDLSEIWPDLPEKGDITDLCSRLGVDETIRAVAELCSRTPVWLPQSSPPRFLAKSAEEFGEDDTRFVWHPYIPVGDYSVLMAEGGAGKTMFCCGIAASLSRGELLPGDEVNTAPPPGNILFISAEDRGELLKKRLTASGANLARIRILDCMASEGLNFHEGIEDFRTLVLQARPCLVIIDPWHAFLGEKVDINRVNALRPVLQKLANIAKEAECGMILISHVNKRAQSENANNAATGSVDLINASRSAFRIIRCDEPGKKDMRIAVHTKSNYAREGRSVLYAITGGGGVKWAGFSDITRSVLEEAARYHKTPAELLIQREKDAEEENALANAVRELAVEGKIVNISYEEMRETYGDTIFGSGQPKKLLDKLANTIYVEGITITTGKNVKYKGKSVNGFSVTKQDPFETPDGSAA
ncbi:MAG: AAA family ATPase [Oscillospiraceae bacterium]|nr:AAA family ATPase [Oscillospiraceae bacterium]